MPEIPQELADYIAALTPDDLERIRGEMKELERLGVLPCRGAEEEFVRDGRVINVMDQIEKYRKKALPS